MNPADNASSRVQERLAAEQYTWLITGVAGFIGSNLLEKLLQLDQVVVGIDNFDTGYRHNLSEVQSLVSAEQYQTFTFGERALCSNR